MAKQKGTSQALSRWDEQMAADAEVAAGMEAGVGAGKSFQTQGGILKFGGNVIPNNKMAVIIVDHGFENTYYRGAYDPKNIESPFCFSMGRKEDELAPHESVVKAGQQMDEGQGCASCALNQFKSAGGGRNGKACSNRRRLLLLSAGDLDNAGRFKPYDAKALKELDLGLLKLPPTSINPWATFVKQLKAAYARPPHGVIAIITLEKDASTQQKFSFEYVANVPDKLMAVVMERRKEALESLLEPYKLTVPIKKGKGAKAAPAGRAAAAPPQRAAGKAFGAAAKAKKGAKAAPAGRAAAAPKGAPAKAAGFGGGAAKPKARKYD